MKLFRKHSRRKIVGLQLSVVKNGKETLLMQLMAHPSFPLKIDRSDDLICEPIYDLIYELKDSE